MKTIKKENSNEREEYILEENEEVKQNENKQEETQENKNQEEVNNEVQAETTDVQENQSELDELNDRYKRLLAEFENYKKRSQKERDGLYGLITGDVVSTILPIMDNLEKAAEAKTEDTNYQDGVKMVSKQLYDALTKLGLKEISSVGETFDPELHEAVSHIEDAEKGEKEIVEEYRKGYKIGNKVIRHSMVIVAN